MYYMVFDVESVGLHGDGFAYGFVIIDEAGREIASGFGGCDPERAESNRDPDGRAWVGENIPDYVQRGGSSSPSAVRDGFWQAWLQWKASGAVLVADCAWPVEARFLAACIDDDPEVRRWQGPYPLHDVATARLMAGLDPLATVERLPNELPIHDPLADARQSARLWIEALRAIGTSPLYDGI